MITTTWQCDRCDAQQDKPEQMWEVAVTCRSGDDRQYVSSPRVVHKELWCRKCCDELAIIGRISSAADKTLPPPPTLEDLIRELLRETVREIVREELPS